MANGMEQSMMPQQGGPQQGQQAGPPPQEQEQGMNLNQDKLYPSNDEEAEKLENMLLSMLYDEKMGMKVVEAIINSPTIEDGVAKMTATIIMKMVTAITQKTGRDIDPEYLDELVDLVSKELFRMLFVAKQIKEQPSKETMMQIGDMALETIEQMIMAQVQQGQQQGQQGGPPPQGGPQGPPQQGQPAGPPQQGQPAGPPQQSMMG